MNFGFLGTDDTPAAFGFDAAMGGFGLGVAVAHSGAVGHLVKAVACGVWADLNRFKQNVVSWVAHGLGSCLKIAELGVVQAAIRAVEREDAKLGGFGCGGESVPVPVRSRWWGLIQNRAHGGIGYAAQGAGDWAVNMADEQVFDVGVLGNQIEKRVAVFHAVLILHGQAERGGRVMHEQVSWGFWLLGELIGEPRGTGRAKLAGMCAKFMGIKAEDAAVWQVLGVLDEIGHGAVWQGQMIAQQGAIVVVSGHGKDGKGQGV